MTYSRVLAFALAYFGFQAVAGAVEIKNPLAIYAGLDKITGRIVKFEVKMDETVQFGALQITPRACYTKPPDETPQTVSFLQVDEIAAKQVDDFTVKKQLKRIFSGWIFAASPGLNGIEHPVYDVWLLDCVGGKETVADADDESSPSGQSQQSLGASARGAAGATQAPALKPSLSEAPAAAAETAPGSAPALGPPIEVGAAPGDLPAADPVPPPGPLSPELRPRRARPAPQPYPPTDDGFTPNGSNPDQGVY